MIDLFWNHYFWNLLAALPESVLLSLMGPHLLMRQQAMQTLCLAQAAACGLLLSFLFTESGHLLGAWFLAAPVLFWVQAKEVFYLSLFVFFTSAIHLLQTVFPVLEAHKVVLGDLVTLEEGLSQLIFLISRWR